MNTWAAPTRTPAAAEIYLAAENDRASRPEKYRLGVDAVDVVIDRASRGRGAGEFGDPARWRPGLDQYLGSAAEDGRLNALGARTAQNTAVGRLVARTAISEYLRERPDVASRRLQPPIVITGGWRTGTTYLFRLLALDPQLRAPLPAELGAPWRLPGDQTAQDRTERLGAAAAGHEILHLLNPAMAVVHDSGPAMAEECVLAMGTTLRNWGFTATTRLNGYAKWLAGQSFSDEYQQHRRTLQILDADDGRRWVIKAPAHIAELDHLIATYPGACIVHLHRDIVDTVASGASLFATYRSTYSDHVDGVDVGTFQTDQTETWLRRWAATRRTVAAQSVAWLDLQYTDLVADPTGVLQRIYAAADLEAPDTSAMLAQNATLHPRNGKGTHSYDAQLFGIDPESLRERMRFYTDSVPAVTP